MAMVPMLTLTLLTDTLTTARGLLMLSPLLRLLLSPLLMPTTAITVTAWPTTGTVMVWLTNVTDTSTARGPLTLSPLLMLTTALTVMLTTELTVMLTMVTTATPTLTVATTDTITKLLLFC